MKVCRNLNDLPAFGESVITIGSFDGVHTGHRQIISKIVNIGKKNNYTSIIITFEPHPRLVINPDDKSLKLIYSIEEKLDALKETGIDYVVIAPFTKAFASMSPEDYIKDFLVAKFTPAHIVIGYDHKFGAKRKGDIELLKSFSEEYNYELSEIKAQEIDQIAVSSTKIRKAVTDGNISLANSYLETTFPMTGHVVKGQQLGRKIGFPTANLELDQTHKLIPGHGVYAAKAMVDNKLYTGMLYIGTKPTIDGSFKEVIEINIFDFSEDIYGKKVKLLLHDYIRGDVKFDGIEALTTQLSQDEKKVREIFGMSLNKQEDDVAVVVLNYNGKQYLETYLPSLLDSYSKGNYSVYVIDNASTDESISFLTNMHPNVTVIPLSENYGFAGGYNEGLKQISANYYALVNSDLEVTDDWLDPILHKMEADKRIAVVQPKILSLKQKDEFEYAGAAGGFLDMLNYPYCRGRIFDSVEKDQNQYDNEQDIFWASGAAFVIRADLMNDFGGFDADFFAHQEEIDLCWRLKNAGYKICCVPSSTVYHLGGGTLDYHNPRKTYLNFRNNFISGFKNESFLSLLWKLPVRFVLDLLAAIQFTVSGQVNSGLAVFKAMGYVLSHPLQIWRKRKQTTQQLQRLKIAEADTSGRTSNSIVWDYYVRRKKTYQSITKQVLRAGL